MVLGDDCLHELRIRTVMDSLRLAEPLHRTVDPLEEHDERIRLRSVLMPVIVRKIGAPEAQCKLAA